MARITKPTTLHNNESFGGVENIENLLTAIESTLSTGVISIVDSSAYFTAPDTSIWSWGLTKV